jgi:TCP-1/cpn60 chaperonin family
MGARRRCTIPHHPAAAHRARTPLSLCADLSKVQDDEVGDGTTSVAVLAGELLREAEALVNQKLHPMIIIAGFRQACEVAVQALEARAFDHSGVDGGGAEALRRDLINIARTTLSSKILTHDKEHFAKIAVDSVMCLKGRTNLEAIHVIKKAGGTLKESFLAEVRPCTRVSRVAGSRWHGSCAGHVVGVVMLPAWDNMLIRCSAEGDSAPTGWRA